MRRLVVDANIAAKWYLPEADSGAAEMLFADELEFHAPNFLATEFANICWKHSVAGRTSMDAWRLASHQLKKSIPYCIQMGNFTIKLWNLRSPINTRFLTVSISHLQFRLTALSSLRTNSFANNLKKLNTAEG
jgi:predicted nucleic acid-binding protein